MHIFGDIFRYRERDYVWLGSNGEITHAAKILDTHETEQIRSLDNKRAARPDFVQKTDSNKIFCYVILTTPDLKGCCAHLNTPDQDSEVDCYFEWLEVSFNNIDQKALKMEILREGSSVSGSLKKTVEQLDI